MSSSSHSIKTSYVRKRKNIPDSSKYCDSKWSLTRLLETHVKVDHKDDEFGSLSNTFVCGLIT
jgi:hypothetical protein